MSADRSAASGASAAATAAALSAAALSAADALDMSIDGWYGGRASWREHQSRAGVRDRRTMSGRRPARSVAGMTTSVSNSLILRGILAVIVGVLALAWPGVTILALVILFAVYAFMDSGFEALRAFSSGRAGPVLGHLLLGLVDLAAGVIALAWPLPPRWC